MHKEHLKILGGKFPVIDIQLKNEYRMTRNGSLCICRISQDTWAVGDHIKNHPSHHGRYGYILHYVDSGRNLKNSIENVVGK